MTLSIDVLISMLVAVGIEALAKPHTESARQRISAIVGCVAVGLNHTLVRSGDLSRQEPQTPTRRFQSVRPLQLYVHSITAHISVTLSLFARPLPFFKGIMLAYPRPFRWSRTDDVILLVMVCACTFSLTRESNVKKSPLPRKFSGACSWHVSNVHAVSFAVAL